MINQILMPPPFKSILHRLKGSNCNIKMLILPTFQQKSFDCIPLQFIVDSKTRTNFEKITFRILKPGRALPQFLGNCIKQSLSGRPNSRALCVARQLGGNALHCSEHLLFWLWDFQLRCIKTIIILHQQIFEFQLTHPPTKGQLILKCPFFVTLLTKIATKLLSGFLPYYTSKLLFELRCLSFRLRLRLRPSANFLMVAYIKECQYTKLTHF